MRDERGSESERSTEGSGPNHPPEVLAQPEEGVVASAAAPLPARETKPLDDTTFDGLMAAHGAAVYSLCLRVLGHPGRAEEVHQEVFIQAHRDFNKFEGRAGAARKTWLFSIAINRCKDAIKSDRRRQRRIQVDDLAVLTSIDSTDGPDVKFANARQLADLERCLRELGSESRLAVVARFLVGMSFEEMGRALKVKADTLQARVTRALPVLKRCMGHKGWTVA